MAGEQTPADYVESGECIRQRLMTEIAEKWGFGMAPPKQDTQLRRRAAVQFTVEAISNSSFALLSQPEETMISETKGLFTRIFKADQWDWFTVNSQLGYPSPNLAKKISEQLSDLRKSGIKGDETGYRTAQTILRALPTRKCLGVFLGNISVSEEVGAGWIYILSTRDNPTLLKIGMTNRTVEQRAREISGATGVAVPFGVRRCWRVMTPSKAEQLVHGALLNSRLRNDREFFRIDFVEAAKIISATLQNNELELRTLDNLAALSNTT
jgi:hypothetical protein